MNAHSKRRKLTCSEYKCELCVFSTPDQSSLRNHMRDEHEESHVCPICGKGDIMGETKFTEHLRCHEELLAKYRLSSINDKEK